MHAVLLEPRFLAAVGPVGPIDSRQVLPSPRMECFTPLLARRDLNGYDGTGGEIVICNPCLVKLGMNIEIGFIVDNDVYKLKLV